MNEVGAKLMLHFYLVTLIVTTILFFQMQNENPKSFIEKFSFILNQYLQALGGIVPIFNYMVRC